MGLKCYIWTKCTRKAKGKVLGAPLSLQYLVFFHLSVPCLVDFHEALEFSIAVEHLLFQTYD